jgi:hypothetical protein
MPDALLLAFEGHRREREIVGKILIAYGELEHVVLDMLIATLRDGQAAIRTMYQLRSEANRLAVAEAIITPSFTAAKLAVPLKEGLDAMNHCKKIRNNYAHCIWVDDNGLLRFGNLEEPAKSKGEKCQLVTHPLTLTLLRKQWAYFDYTQHLLMWVGQQFREHNQQEQVGPLISKPKRVPLPKLHSLGETRMRLAMSVGRWRFQPSPPPKRPA